MDLPINGYLYKPDNTGYFMHSHHLYITSWGGNPVHVHPFSRQTSYVLEHSHLFAGVTKPAPNGIQHTHSYFVYTSIAGDHIHEIRGVTSPAIPLPNGGHYHEFEGTTTIDGLTPHSHRYSGRTTG